MAKLTYGLGVLISPEAVQALEAEAQALPETWEVEATARYPGGPITVCVINRTQRVAAILSIEAARFEDPDWFEDVVAFLQRQGREIEEL